MSLLFEKLRKTVPAYRDAVKEFGKANGDVVISQVSVGALLGGQRGVLGLLCDTSRGSAGQGSDHSRLPADGSREQAARRVPVAALDG